MKGMRVHTENGVYMLTSSKVLYRAYVDGSIDDRFKAMFNIVIVGRPRIGAPLTVTGTQHGAKVKMTTSRITRLEVVNR